MKEMVGRADAIGVPEADPREAARRPTAFEAALPGGKRSGESGSGDCLDEGPTQGYRSRPPRTEIQETKNTNAARSRGSRGIALRLMRRVNVPRAPSLELYVLPNGGGQLPLRLLIPQSATNGESFRMELRGIEPLTSAVRLQRSPS